MQPVNNKIIVSCDVNQKNKMLVGGVYLSTAALFESNYREKSPTICTVVEGNETVKAGNTLLVHHNSLYLPSPYHLCNDLFSIPFSKILFCKIDDKGQLEPICGNILCERIVIPSLLDIPIEHQKTYDKVYRVTNSGETKYKEGQVIHTRPSAGYDIVYNWNGVEKRVTKIDSEQICGIVK